MAVAWEAQVEVEVDEAQVQEEGEEAQAHHDNTSPLPTLLPGQLATHTQSL